MANEYCTTTDVTNIDGMGIFNTAHTTALTNIIESVSRAIDNKTGRRFYAVSETRFYTPKNTDYVYIHDISAASGVFVYTDNDGDGTHESTWSTTDYNLSPYNSELNGFPYNKVERTNNSLYLFPRLRKGLKITASFGFAAIPPVIVRATALQSSLILARQVELIGAASLQIVDPQNKMSIPNLDPVIESMINPYILRV